jgi:hypothetical protein
LIDDRVLLERNMYVESYYLERGASRKLWKGEVHDRVVVTISGDVGGELSVRKKTFRDARAARLTVTTEGMQRLRDGYDRISPEEFASLADSTSSAATSERKPSRASSTRNAGSKSPSRPGTRKVPAKRHNARSAFPVLATSPTYHVVEIGKKRPRQVHGDRATSGGSPILSGTQEWPTCGYCDTKLGLYLQFDFEDRFKLPFASGSHLLLFNCVRCAAIPQPPPRDRVPKSWLDPAHEQSYRLILNRPGVAERIHAPDREVRAQSVTFEGRTEVFSEGLDGLVGEERFKVGGVPHWVQPPRSPRCACGALMSFVFQIPSSARPSWRLRDGRTLPFCAELDVFAFACTGQCSPYAGVLIAER